MQTNRSNVQRRLMRARQAALCCLIYCYEPASTPAVAVRVISHDSYHISHGKCTAFQRQASPLQPAPTSAAAREPASTHIPERTMSHVVAPQPVLARRAASPTRRHRAPHGASAIRALLAAIARPWRRGPAPTSAAAGALAPAASATASRPGSAWTAAAPRCGY